MTLASSTDLADGAAVPAQLSNDDLPVAAINFEQLADRATRSATSHVVASVCRDTNNLLEQCRQNIRDLEVAMRARNAADDSGIMSDPESIRCRGMWCSLAQELRDIRERLPANFGDGLPNLE